MSDIKNEKKDEFVQEELAEVHGLDNEFKFDPYTPFPDDGPEETQFTIRAVIVGCLLGAVVGASNLYLGLKTGFTFGASLFGAIFGFAILKPLSKVLGGSVFGPKENCTVQTAATAAGGLGIIFVSAIPALYRLGLMLPEDTPEDLRDDKSNRRLPSEDYGKLFLLTLVSAYYGLFFAVPLRRHFVIRMKLIFPTPTASALTIRNLHESTAGAAAGNKKAWAMGLAFLGAMVWYILGFFAPGFIRQWNIFDWMARRASGQTAFALQSAHDWRWLIEWTPAFIGAGMLSGMNASYSLWGGSILAYGIIGPALIRNGLAEAALNGDFEGTGPESYFYFAPLLNKTTGVPSARYWMLWPGVSIMLFYSFAELAMNGKAIVGAVVTGVKELFGAISAALGKNTDYSARVDENDPAKPEDQVPTWFWVTGVLISSVFTIIVMFFYFKVSVGETILAIILAFFFAFIGLQSAGDTDINPISAVAKASQLIFGGVSKGQGITGVPAETSNLIGGTLAGAAAAQAVDMVGDLKTGYLLNATPKSQFYAQLVGAAVSVVISVPLFVVFTKAYPCILYNKDYPKCEFDPPSVAAWASVASVLTSDKNPIPTSSGIAAIILSIIAVISVIAKRYVPAQYRVFIPNMNAIGIAFILPNTVYGTAMVIGATWALLWKKKFPSSFEMFAYAIAAGLTAGEGIGGLIVAIFQIGGIKGELVASRFGCPTDPETNTIPYCG
ncbi:hypothetical protein HDU97_005224 [Phlyctochytrium planicorne]|nr:hypothetical protein HDU97_005224 [Phlyctochytrium planicorne]